MLMTDLILLIASVGLLVTTQGAIVLVNKGGSFNLACGKDIRDNSIRWFKIKKTGRRIIIATVTRKDMRSGTIESAWMNKARFTTLNKLRAEFILNIDITQYPDDYGNYACETTDRNNVTKLRRDVNITLCKPSTSISVAVFVGAIVGAVCGAVIITVIVMVVIGRLRKRQPKEESTQQVDALQNTTRRIQLSEAVTPNSHIKEESMSPKPQAYQELNRAYTYIEDSDYQPLELQDELSFTSSNNVKSISVNNDYNNLNLAVAQQHEKISGGATNRPSSFTYDLQIDVDNKQATITQNRTFPEAKIVVDEGEKSTVAENSTDYFVLEPTQNID